MRTSKCSCVCFGDSVYQYVIQDKLLNLNNVATVAGILVAFLSHAVSLLSLLLFSDWSPLFDLRGLSRQYSPFHLIWTFSGFSWVTS